MGTRGKGYLKQNFEIRLDMTKLTDYIADQIVKAIESEKTQGKQTFTDVEINDAEIDGDALTITGNYDTAFESWYCAATLEEPEENELEYEGIEGWGNGLLCMLPDNLKNLIEVSEVVANEEMIEFDEPEIPECWYEDRQVNRKKVM